MAYADYAFYTNEYFGNAISEDEFPRMASRASDYIYAYTKGISDTVTGRDMEMVQKATCAIAEIVNDETNMTSNAFTGGAKVSSESVGSWSRSYATASLSGTEVEYIEKRKLDALTLYLGNLSAFASIFRVRSYPNIQRGCGR